MFVGQFHSCSRIEILTVQQFSTKKISILYLTTSYLPKIGGREYHVRNLATGMARTGIFDVTILTGTDEGFSDSVEDGLRIIRVPYYSIPVGGPFAYRIPHAVFKTIQELKPDIIHAHDHFHSVSLISALLKRNSKLVITIHSEPNFYNSMPLVRVVLRPYNVLVSPLLFKLCSRVIRFTYRKNLLDHFARVSFIPGFIDTDFIDSTQSVSVQELHGLQNYKTVFFCARVERRKGVFELLHAFVEVTEQHPDAYLIISGPDAGDTKNLKALALRLGIKNILFTGLLSDSVMHSTFKQSSAFVLSSFSESATPASVQRAMYLGCPVVYSTCNPKVIVDSVNGFLVEAGNVSSIADGINRALTEDVSTIVRNARRDVEKYTLRAYTDTMVNLYKDVYNS